MENDNLLNNDPSVEQGGQRENTRRRYIESSADMRRVLNEATSSDPPPRDASVQRDVPASEPPICNNDRPSSSARQGQEDTSPKRCSSFAAPPNPKRSCQSNSEFLPEKLFYPQSGIGSDYRQSNYHPEQFSAYHQETPHYGYSRRHEPRPDWALQFDPNQNQQHLYGSMDHRMRIIEQRFQDPLRSGGFLIYLFDPSSVVC
jgi:hypothetical protein